EGAAQAEDQLYERGREKEEKCDRSPEERSSGKAEPSSDEQDERKGLDERTTQVVEDLPAGDCGDRVADVMARLVGHAAEKPLRDLPVAADPAVLAAGVSAVVGGGGGGYIQ